MIRFSPLYLLFLLTLVVGCDVTPQVERAIERELPAIIGPADRYEARVTGLRLRAGEAERVDIRGDKVRPEDAPRIEQFNITLDGVRYDVRAERLERVDSARAEAQVRPGDLATFLEEHRNVRQASITLQEPDRAQVRLRPELAGLALPPGVVADVSGRLVVIEGRIHYEVESVRAGGAALGAAAARRVSELINPVFDLTDAEPALHVSAVTVVDDRIRLQATVDPAGFVRR